MAARSWPRGELTASFALTETEAGSDPSTLTTSAERDGDTWVLNGSKRYITNAPIADVFMVFARTNPAAKATRGISTFLVPRDLPGLTVGPKDKKMGQFGAWTSEVFFDDVRVDAPGARRRRRRGRQRLRHRHALPRPRPRPHGGLLRGPGRSPGRRVGQLRPGAQAVGRARSPASS